MVVFWLDGLEILWLFGFCLLLSWWILRLTLCLVIFHVIVKLVGLETLCLLGFGLCLVSWSGDLVFG